LSEGGYQVLARKWRPQRFAELAGLEHIARTLQNAIRRERVGHAYLFTGSRGVGKTSAARILAKALNCKAGPAPEPCNQCDNCVAITAGSSPDVIEIDGASNRGVNEIRLLREGVSYLPQGSPYKIYIIDEVHMLTTEAFNALLKTLEEPPGHVKFIMATTDVHKLPLTILSRCQRFDFGRLTQATISSTLAEIGQREGFTFEPGCIELLAREARGSMRDALSLLDQVRSYAGDRIGLADFRAALGLVEVRHCLDLLRDLVTGEVAVAVARVEDLEQAGVDLKDFAREFLYFLRDVLFLKLSGRLAKLVGIGADEAVALKPLLAQRALPYWQQLFLIWQEQFVRIRTAQIPRLALESALIELGLARDLEPVDELLRRLQDCRVPGSGGEEVGDRAGAGTVQDAVPRADSKTDSAVARPSLPVVPPLSVPKTAAKGSGKVREPSSPPTATSQPEVKVGVLPPAPPPEVELLEPLPDGDCFSADESLAVDTVEKPPLESSARAAPKPADDFSSRPPSDTIPAKEPRSSLQKDAGPAAAASKAGITTLPTTASPATGSREVVEGRDDTEALTAERWEAFRVWLEKRNRRLGAMLQRSRLRAAGHDGRHLQIEVLPYTLEPLKTNGMAAAIQAQLQNFLGREGEFLLEFQSLAGDGNAGSESRPAGPRTLPGKDEIFKDPLVRFISDRFGGRVTEIRPRRQ